jgi:hypothetical protein
MFASDSKPRPAFVMSQVLIAMVSAVVLLGTDGCRKGQEEDRAVTRTKEPSTSLTDLAHEAGVTFPPSARLIGFSHEAGIDDYLNFKVEIDAKDLAAFLASSPIPADALQPGEHGRLGPDEGYWDPHRAARLRTGQKMMPNARSLNIGIGEGGRPRSWAPSPTRVTV